jgi:hypothetical protein
MLSLSACVTLAGAPRAEVIGPVLEKGSVSVGAQERRVERTLYREGVGQEVEQSETAVVGRWGATDFATLSFELSRNLTGRFMSDDEVEDFYLVGGALQAVLWRHDRLVVSAAYQYTANLFRVDEEIANITSSTYGAEIMVQRAEQLKGIGLTWFAGPAYSVHVVNYERGSANNERVYSSDSNFGGVAGLNLLLWEHVNLAAHVLWVENPQPRYGVEYRF